MTAASEKQISYINSLRESRSIGKHDELIAKRIADGLDVATASQIIDWLRFQPRKNVVVVALEDGMYRMDGTIFKVQHAVHGSGHQYAKKLVGHRYCEGHESTDGNITYCNGDCRPAVETEWKFEMAPGMIRRLRPEHKMSLADAKKFGALYGTCCVCGRTLTDEVSIEAGIGPVCAQKF